MDIEDEDDFYAPEEPQVPTEDEKKPAAQQPIKSDELEEGEEEDEGAAMDEDEDDSVRMLPLLSPLSHHRPGQS